MKNLNIQHLAQEGAVQSGTTLLQNLERLVPDLQGLEPDSAVKWRFSWQLRPAAAGGDDVWLNLQAQAALPFKCQRCMGPLQTPIDFDYWFRFVATEEIAQAQDEESEEDLLVFESHFDAMQLLEDELIMAQPLVPMHDECPVTPVFTAGEVVNPFSVLAGLKDKSKS